jgi:hypothetical protein
MFLESLPGRLTSDIQGRSNLGPSDLSFSGSADPDAKLLFDLEAYPGNFGQMLQYFRV